MDVKQIAEDYFKTWLDVILRPGEFFSRWDPKEPWEKVAVFTAISGLAAGVITAVLSFFTALGSVIVYPVLLLVGTVIGGLILFICFRFLGGTGDVESTIKMVGYTQAVAVISMGIPIVGFLAGFYQLWLLVVGGKKVHSLDTVKAAIAVLIPAIVITACVFALAIALGIGIGLMR